MRRGFGLLILTGLVSIALGLAAGDEWRQAAAQDAEQDAEQNATPEVGPEGAMTVARLDELIVRVDPEARGGEGRWEFTVDETTVLLVTDPGNNRMRLMTPIKPSGDLTPAELLRLSQANFDTALDARYAVARNILWATYIHPLQELHDRQFLSAIGQTVNAAQSYGGTYSSGFLSFGGGDSGQLLQRELIDELLRRGEDI